MLTVKNLTVSYGNRHAKTTVISGLNVQFSTGINTILGPNGAGKTTFLKAVFGLLPSDGEIWYGTENLKTAKADRRTELMAYLPQTDLEKSSLSVLEMILLGRLPSLGKHVKPEDLEKVMETMKLLGIEALAERNFSELSGGQKKLVFIAQTLVRNPRLLLLDEPVNSLDLQKQLELCFLLRKITDERAGKLDIIMVLHDLNLAARFSDHIYVFHKGGRLYSSGKPADIFSSEMLREVYGVIASVSTGDDGVPLISAERSVREQ